MGDKARFGRVTALVAPAIPIGTTAGVEIGRGWRPTSDDGAIAWRTFDVFSSHAPLVGAFNDVSPSSLHPVFDLGPLQYYLLAVPERIDPLHGLLWGAALVVALLCALSVEAAWRAGGAVAGVAVSLGLVVITATQVVAVLNLPWNPNLGLFAFAAALVMSAVTAVGRTAWWPVGVGCGVLAAECHLVFGVASVAALLVGIVLGLVARAEREGLRRGWVQLVGGIGVGLLGLAAPIAQQLADRHGNLIALKDNLHQLGPSRGLPSGFSALDRATGIWPAWTHPVPPIGTLPRDFRFFTAVMSGSGAGGVVIVVAAGAIGIGALVCRRPGLGGTALVVAAAAVGLAWTLGAVSARQTAVLTYVDVALWPVGMMLDVVFAWGAAELATSAIRRFRRPGAHDAARPGAHRGVVAGTIAGLGVLAAAVVWSLTSIVPATAHSDAVIGGWEVSRAVVPITAEIEHMAPRGPFVVEPSVALFARGLPTWALTEGVAYALHADGYDVRLEPPMAPQLGGDASAPRHGGVAFQLVPGARGVWHVRRVTPPVPTRLLAWFAPTHLPRRTGRLR